MRVTSNVGNDNELIQTKPLSVINSDIISHKFGLVPVSIEMNKREVVDFLAFILVVLNCTGLKHDYKHTSKIYYQINCMHK